MKAVERLSIVIGSTEVSVDKGHEPINIKNLAQCTMQKVQIGVDANVDENEDNKRKFKDFQLKWCSLGLIKMNDISSTCMLQENQARSLKFMKDCCDTYITHNINMTDMHISMLEQMVDACIALRTKNT